MPMENMPMGTITSEEVDATIRPGMEALAGYFRGDDTQRKRALDMLGGLREGTRRKQAENNELRNVLAIGELAGAKASDYKPLFDALAGKYGNDRRSLPAAASGELVDK